MTTITAGRQPALSRADIAETATALAALQRRDGAFEWYPGGPLDPWNHLEAAMGLAVAGEQDAVEAAFNWLATTQRRDGSWPADGRSRTPAAEAADTNFTAYCASALWHHYLVFSEQHFVDRYWPMVQRGLDFVVRYQNADGTWPWQVLPDGQVTDERLLTGCASMTRSLACGVHLADVLGAAKPQWQQAVVKSVAALRRDELYTPKERFSMDWYYPVLAGALSKHRAVERLKSRWEHFMVPGLGCRCVSDEPWVTAAETAELGLALCALDQRQRAHELLDQIQFLRTEAGLYWTGYVYPDETIWPQQTTGWTAGAMLLACDAVYELTPAARWGTEPLRLR